MTGERLSRELGLTSAVMITVGSVIGSGIFLKPLAISQALPSVGWIYACWVVLGIVCLFGAFAYAELGTMFPEAGGAYAFLREGWGRLPAFLYGWCLLLVINTGTLAGLAVAFARGLSGLVEMSEWANYAVAIGMILLLAAVNHFGVGWGAALQNLTTFTKLAALAAIVVGGYLVVGAPSPTHAEPAVTSAMPDVKGLIAASVAIFWAYEGWYQLPFNAAELKNPHRDLPRGLIWGMFILVAAYLAVNAVYLRLVPLAEMRTLSGDMDVPTTAVTRAFGSSAGDALGLLICVSVFGSANPNLLSSPRAFLAMAEDGLMPKILTGIHARWRTPTVAIWFQALWAIVLVVVLKTFKDITDYVVFASLIFYALVVAAVYRLRLQRPQTPRPYRCFGYPWSPAIFILVVAFVDVWTLMEEDMRSNALIGLGILAAGLPVYFVFGRNGARSGG
ncbi:MAG: amino acid permease [Planctomycetota bacterium]